MGTKTDNKDPSAKLELRRHFLRAYHNTGEIDVLDCCQATGFLWRTLRREFPVTRYWGVDLNPKKGRLKIDSARILAQPGWPQNIVDVDTYGSPWKHWAALLPHVRQPTTIFLTIGQVSMGTDSEILRSLGLGQIPVPPGIALSLHGLALSHLIGAAAGHNLSIVECKEATGGPSKARYLGLHLTPNPPK